LRILYLTDTHFRGTTPRSRLDDLPQALLGKLAEVVDLARQHQVAAILHGGDLFDRPDVAPAVATQFLRVLRTAPCPVYGIAGNHDLYGLNPDSLSRTMLGLAHGVHLLQLIRPGAPVWLEDQTARVQVTGQEYHAEIDRRDPRLDYCVGGDSLHQRDATADFAIHLTHGMLLEHPFFEGMAHTLLKSIMPHTLADITLGGHYHPGWAKSHDHKGRLFVNPGAIARLGSQTADLTRLVQVVLLDCNRGQPIQVQFLPLQSAQPGDQVLDTQARESQMAREIALADFIQGIGSASQFEVLEVREIMERVAQSGMVSQQVKDEALRRLAQAQEELNDAGEEEPA
jgi:DNA repair protein SbcD/Mre11